MEGISYIITTYNRNALLQKAINAVIAERILPSELIVVDDCSSQTISLSTHAKSVFGQDIRLISNAQNLGVIGARNVGIKAAKYEFLLFLDDDDESFPNRSKNLFNYIDKSNYAFVAAKCEMRTPISLKIVPNCPEIVLSNDSLLQFTPHINAIIWRKKALLALNGLDNRVPYLGEHITMQLMLLKGEQALQVEDVVAYFSYLGDGLTQHVTEKNIMKTRLIAFYEVLLLESQQTAIHAYFAHLYSLLLRQNIYTFDNYVSFMQLEAAKFRLDYKLD